MIATVSITLYTLMRKKRVKGFSAGRASGMVDANAASLALLLPVVGNGGSLSISKKASKGRKTGFSKTGFLSKGLEPYRHDLRRLENSRKVSMSLSETF